MPVLTLIYVEIYMRKTPQKEPSEANYASLVAFSVCEFLPCIFWNFVEVLDIVTFPQQFHKVFVVGYDHELEVALSGAKLDDPKDNKQKTMSINK